MFEKGLRELSEKNTIAIKECPLCSNSHSYSLLVQRSSVFKMMVADMTLEPEKPRRVRFKRIFTCPVKNNMFQATIIMYETSDSKIKSLEVEGIIE